MRLRGTLVGLSLALTLSGGAIVLAQTDAATQFANGQAALSKGEFQTALAALKAATKADPENDEYFHEYALLRRVMHVRKQLKEETDAETWQKMSRALYNYYRLHKIAQEALAAARGLYDKAPSADSAALLADAQLEVGDNAAAAALLGGLAEEQRSVQTDVLRGIALARLDKAAEAKAVATKVKLPSDADGLLCFDAARLYALIGDTERAVAALTSAFEATPPYQLDTVKAEAKASPDLAALIASPSFASALETQSRAASSCAKDRGQCSSKSKSKSESESGCAAEQKKEPACKEHEKAGGK